MFTAVRLTNDQILENATGVGAPPLTWPRPELAIDVLHKSIYAFATGAVADLLAARDERDPGSGTRRSVPVATQTSVRCPGQQHVGHSRGGAPTARKLRAGPGSV